MRIVRGARVMPPGAAMMPAPEADATGHACSYRERVMPLRHAVIDDAARCFTRRRYAFAAFATVFSARR